MKKIILGIDFGTSSTVIYGGTDKDNIKELFFEPTMVAVRDDYEKRGNKTVRTVNDVYLSILKGTAQHINQLKRNDFNDQLLILGESAARVLNPSYSKYLALKANIDTEERVRKIFDYDEALYAAQGVVLYNSLTLVYLTYALAKAIEKAKRVFGRFEVEEIYFTYTEWANRNVGGAVRQSSNQVSQALKQIICLTLRNIEKLMQLFSVEICTSCGLNSGDVIKAVKSIGGERGLSYMPESEAASFAVDCDIREKGSAKYGIENGTQIMIIDCGGGTFDFSTFKFCDDGVELNSDKTKSTKMGADSVQHLGAIGSIDARHGVAGVRFDMETIGQLFKTKLNKLIFEKESKEFWNTFDEYVRVRNSNPNESCYNFSIAGKVCDIKKEHIEKAKEAVFIDKKIDGKLFSTTQSFYRSSRENDGNYRCIVCCVGGLARNKFVIQTISESLREINSSDVFLKNIYKDDVDKLDKLVARGAVIRGFYYYGNRPEESAVVLNMTDFGGNKCKIDLTNSLEDSNDGVKSSQPVRVILAAEVAKDYKITIEVDGENYDIENEVYACYNKDSNKKLIHYNGKMPFAVCGIWATVENYKTVLNISYENSPDSPILKININK